MIIEAIKIKILFYEKFCYRLRGQVSIKIGMPLFLICYLILVFTVNSQPQNHIKARIGQNVSIPCPLDIPVLIYIGWYQCTIEDDCRSHWDEHRVAHVDNKTLVYVDYPKKYELETNGTLTIFDIVPEDDEKLFICKGKIQFSATVENITILEIITGK